MAKARGRASRRSRQTDVKDYRHDETRKNNPPAGLATYEPKRVAEKRYEYDPHLDPQLVWAGKAEHTSFEVPTVSLHIHERVSSSAIVRSVQREEPKQLNLFADPQFPLDQAIEFYQHDMDWANRLVLGDSLLVMNSLLEREGMAGKVQMIYVDPPYGVAYNSNFQPSIRQRDVRDGDDRSLTREPEMIKAYRDTWRLGVHSYLTYLRDRLFLCRELLADSGSIFVQIGDQNVHLVRALLDELFDAKNFVAIIAFRKAIPLATVGLGGVFDLLLWYARDKNVCKYRELFVERELGEGVYTNVELPTGARRPMTLKERRNPSLLPKGARVFATENLVSTGYTPTCIFPFEYKGKVYSSTGGKSWKTNREGMDALARAGRLSAEGKTLRYVIYYDDYPVLKVSNMWTDVKGATDKIAVVQTATKVVERCMLMTTDPGELVLDPTCGAGTTAYVAEQWGRRWITCDTSRIMFALARQRIITASFPYYRLKHPDLGVKGGFDYETVPHITLKSIAQDEPPQEETLYDKPSVDRAKVRVSGPFTVEAIPMPGADGEESPVSSPEAEVRVGAEDPAGDYVDMMVDLLRRDGVTFPGGKKLKLGGLRPLASAGALHAEAEAQEGNRTVHVAVSFGPRYGAVTVRQVEDAVREAQSWADLLVFAGFAFDAEAQAFIQKSPHPRLKTHLAHICPDVELSDLLKTTQGSQLFTVFGQPDVWPERQKDGNWVVELRGVDIYDPNAGEVRSSSGEDVAAWFLDQDYDGRTFCICQAFFPGPGDNPWKKLQRTLRGVVDEEKFEAMRGTRSQPFPTPANERREIAVKVIDYRGDEVVRVMALAEA
ncbi:MAG: site-specific DNA-methyltransferase [Dehalococcoidia bacterium]